MRIIYPYTDEGRTEESYKSLYELVPALEREIFWVGDSDDAYGHLIEQLWADGEEFLLWEHDIVGNAISLAEMYIGPEEWCSSGYTYFNQPVATSGGGLGFTKFGAGLMARWPTMVKEAMELPYPGHPPWHWCGCDYRIYQLLRRGGVQASHYPAVRHDTHHPVGHRPGKSSHGCKDVL